MKIIGVTGGIGAGKSSVSEILRELGAKVIDADQISKQETEPGKPAWKEIVDTFGKEILLPDKTINRKELAKIVFRSESKRLFLERIIHDRVTLEMRKMIKDIEATGFNGVISLDVPIPVHSGFLDVVDSVWVVTCREEERIRRVMDRSGMEYSDAKNRIRAQMPQNEYIRLADEVIENEGNLEELKQKVHKLWHELHDHDHDRNS